jgi:hypothetical protein
MKVFLQNSANLAYLGNQGQWTWRRRNALAFANTLGARQRCHAAKLKDMLLVLSYGDADPPYDIRIAIDN